ncbi:MAG: tetratricopeptide repeat protein [Bryobacteraceae bacterium]|nr:tetratricopeptide repeat protein [Bryobacteraceae bacterium]
MFELRGRIEPAATASVTVFGALTPFNEQAWAGPDGRFKVKNLVPGLYTVAVFVPGRGEVRRTVNVTTAFADARARVDIVVPIETGTEKQRRAQEQKSVVSVRELAIPGEARRAFKDALAALSRRDPAAASEALLRAVKLAPRYSEAWNNLGTIAYQTRQYSQAEYYFRRALEESPGAYSPTVNLGGTLLNLNRPKEALPYNEFAARQEPEEALARAQLGMNLCLLGEVNAGIEHLQAAKRIDPAHFSRPQLFLARAYLAQGDTAAAAREFEDYLRRHPDAPDASAIRDQLHRLRGSP